MAELSMHLKSQQQEQNGNECAENENDTTEEESSSSSSSPSESNAITSIRQNNNKTRNWWRRALNAAIKGGASGSIAMVLQVVLLMWLRTTVNYQYKHGVDIATAVSRLYSEGGVLRFYRGAHVALVTGPISRFGDTAANEGIKELMSGRRSQPPVWAVTLAASVLAAMWRVAITPLDTLKTALQVGSEQTSGGVVAMLSVKMQKHGILVLWDGALANSLATLVGHYPWFIVHNFLEAKIPQPIPPLSKDDASLQQQQHKRHRRLVLLRRALIGFCSSVASDCVSNGIRVVKTYQQTSSVSISYRDALSQLLATNGPAFVVRGLKLKILSNGLSGILFALLWKMIMEQWINNNNNNEIAKTKTSNSTKIPSISKRRGNSKPKRA